ncbi:MAG: hypothetical protein HN712_13275 [Gemmatimonadetes bacterium]|jgi:cytochrome c553|nr:hypothetical protein [Gemmatimonadota bacterium]MBT6147316.1 hypothetical protein [Gemmatimonadota bacterium]MBT7861286.1 hypothetical protein [Gemmatimonadota bacterium]
MKRNLVVLVLAMLFSGLQQATGAPPEGPTDVEIVNAMEQHYRAAILAHDALMQGDLTAFSARLTELAAAELPPNSPDLWVPFNAQMQSAAHSGAKSPDLAAAADAMASVALACGVCHQAVVRGPVYPVPPKGAPDESLKDRMGEHEWATLMIWNGVTGPSEYAWGLGAESLATTRIFAANTQVGDEGSLPEMAAALRTLGEEAKVTTSLHARSAIYGRMLATCGGCHQAAGVKLTR